MNDNHEAALKKVKEAHHFSSWAKQSLKYKGELPYRFYLDAEKLGEFSLESRKPFPVKLSVERHSVTDYLVNDNKKNPHRIAVTIHEFENVADAHAGMVDILSDSMAPRLPSGEELGLDLGDVSFGGHGKIQSSLFFTRFNILAKVESVSEELQSVDELAKIVDLQIQEHQKAMSGGSNVSKSRKAQG